MLDDLFVFPVSIAGRFKGAATQFLGTVDEYVAAFVAVAAGGGDAQRLDPAHARVLAAYAQLEQTLPSVAFDNFPFVQTDSPLTQQGTQLAALEAEVARLALAAKDPAEPAGNARVAAGLRTLQGRIHQAILEAMPRLGEERGWRRRGAGGQQPAAAPAISPAVSPAVSPASAAAPPAGASSKLPTQERDSQGLMAGAGGLALLGICQVVTQLAAGPGRPGKAALPAVNSG